MYEVCEASSCSHTSGIGKLYEGVSGHLKECHTINPAAQVLIKRMQYAKGNLRGGVASYSQKIVAASFLLSNEWLMDRASGRGADKGYEKLLEEFLQVKEAPAYLELNFTSSYDDRIARRAS